MELNGKTPLSKRKLVLDAFRSSTRTAGPRVLILSMVGAVGLNLACANIMVISVRPFLLMLILLTSSILL